MKTKKTVSFTIIALSLIAILASCVSVEKKEDPNFLGDFDGRQIATIMAGNVKLIKKTIKPSTFTFSFYPRTNNLTISFRNSGRSGDNVWATLDQNDRKILIEGIKAFLKQYDEQTLAPENNKKKALFGKTKIELSWGLFGPTRIAEPTLRCEYELLTDNRPYFILGNAMTKSKEGVNCPALRMAFSPAQCEDLLEILSQENLLKLVESLKKEFNKYDTEQKAGEQKGEEKKESKINYN